MKGYRRVNDLVYVHKDEGLVMILGSETLVQFSPHTLVSVSQAKDGVSTTIKLYTNGTDEEHILKSVPIVRVMEGLRGALGTAAV